MSLEEVRAAAEQARGARQEYQRAARVLRAAIVAADRGGAGRNQIVDAARPGLSRRLVYQALQAADRQAGAGETRPGARGPKTLPVPGSPGHAGGPGGRPDTEGRS